MIKLVLSRLPHFILMLGFTNVLCMPLVGMLGVPASAIASLVLAIALCASIVIYYRRNVGAGGETFSETIESKFTSGGSGGGCLFGLFFLAIGIVIIATSDSSLGPRDVPMSEDPSMTYLEQMFFGSTVALIGLGVALMSSGGSK